jgi:hypothetical protein
LPLPAARFAQALDQVVIVASRRARPVSQVTQALTDGMAVAGQDAIFDVVADTHPVHQVSQAFPEQSHDVLQSCSKWLLPFHPAALLHRRLLLFAMYAVPILTGIVLPRVHDKCASIEERSRQLMGALRPGALVDFLQHGLAERFHALL